MKFQSLKKFSFWKYSMLTVLFSGSVFAQFHDGHSTNKALSTQAEIQAKEDLERYFEDVPSAWKGHREFAEWLVRHMQPELVVDLGVDYAFSTFAFANAARDNGFGKVVGIDLFQGDGQTGIRDTQEVVLDWVDQFALDNVEIIKGDFREISLSWTKQIDILHIDGYHTYEAVSGDYKAWAPFVHDDGIILFHDINVPNPDFGVVYFFRELDDGHKLYFLHSYGLGIITKNKKLFQEIKNNFANVNDYQQNPF